MAPLYRMRAARWAVGGCWVEFDTKMVLEKSQKAVWVRTADCVSPRAAPGRGRIPEAGGGGPNGTGGGAYIIALRIISPPAQQCP